MRVVVFMVLIVSVFPLTTFANSRADEPIKPKSERNMNTQGKASGAIHKVPAAEKRERTSPDNVQGFRPSDRRYRIFD